MRGSLENIGCAADKPLHVTGHSLGGAVSAIAAMELRLSGWNVAELYTFGMPRPGNAALAQRFEELFAGKFYRVTHGKDPFVDMPPQIDGYVHLEPEVFYDNSVAQGYKICVNLGMQGCSSQYFSNMPWKYLAVFNKNLVAWHHKYMGIETTQTGCAGDPNAGCNDDIEDSWCSRLIGCNKEARGEHSYCNNPSIVSTTKCRCEIGWCQQNGKCVAKATEPDDMLMLFSALNRSTEQDVSAPAQLALQAPAGGQTRDSLIFSDINVSEHLAELAPTDQDRQIPDGYGLDSTGALGVSAALLCISVGVAVLVARSRRASPELQEQLIEA